MLKPLMVVVALFCMSSLATDSSPVAPSVASFGGLFIMAYRANDPTARIILLRSQNGVSFPASTRSEPFGTSEPSLATPAIFVFNNPTTLDLRFYMFWTNPSTGRIRFSSSGDAITWTPPAQINGIDSTSAGPWAAEQFTTTTVSICVYFKGRTNNNLYQTCSSTATPNSWPAATQLPGDTSTQGPSAAFLFSPNSPSLSRNVVSYRSNDPSGNIFTITQAPGSAFSPATRRQPFGATNLTPAIFWIIQPGSQTNVNLYDFFTESSSGRIRFSVSIDNGVTWIPTQTINGVDTTKSFPWAAATESRMCVYFISNDATNAIRATCSTTGFPNTWPTSSLIN